MKYLYLIKINYQKHGQTVCEYHAALAEDDDEAVARQAKFLDKLLEKREAEQGNNYISERVQICPLHHWLLALETIFHAMRTEE